MSLHKSYPFGPLARSGKPFLPGSLFDGRQRGKASDIIQLTGRRVKFLRGLEALMPRMRCRAFPAVCAAAAAILACQCILSNSTMLFYLRFFLIILSGAWVLQV